MDVPTGTLKWFRGKVMGSSSSRTAAARTYISAAEKAGFTGLAEGAKVSSEVVANRGKRIGGEFAPRLI
jgi:CspA family cold shock protein